MDDADSNKDLELEPELELQPDATPDAGGTDASGADGQVEGQWVWQFAAPPPPPSFLAVFFSGTAHKELYRFFACALLVVVGCLLPWGPVTVETLAEDGTAVESLMPIPDVHGYETPAGAISLMLGLWLLFSSCYGIYTRRQKILPVFLMIEPAIVTLLRTLDAWGRLESEGLDKVVELFEVAGSGVMLTLVGSCAVTGGFFFLLGKVYTKKDDKGAARREARGDKGGKGKSSSRAGKGGKGGKGAAKDAGADGAGASTVAEAAVEGGSGEETPEAGKPDEGAGDAKDEDGKGGGSGRSRRSRGRRR